MEVGGNELEVDIGAQNMAHSRALRNGKKGEMVKEKRKKGPFVKAANGLGNVILLKYPSPQEKHFAPLALPGVGCSRGGEQRSLTPRIRPYHPPTSFPSAILPENFLLDLYIRFI